MPRITKILLLIATALAATGVADGQGRLEGSGAARRFISEKYGFSIAVPRGWLVDPSKDTPVYFSFSPAEAEDFNRQLRLPRGGAVISLVAQESLPMRSSRTLSDWAVADARGTSAESPSARPFETPTESGMTSAIVSSYDTATFGPDDRSEHHVSIFWEFREKRFAAHLLYPAHDPKGTEFEKVFLQTVRSIRPMGKGSKP
jgi:hypothetical protein